MSQIHRYKSIHYTLQDNSGSISIAALLALILVATLGICTSRLYQLEAVDYDVQYHMLEANARAKNELFHQLYVNLYKPEIMDEKFSRMQQVHYLQIKDTQQPHLVDNWTNEPTEIHNLITQAYSMTTVPKAEIRGYQAIIKRPSRGYMEELELIVFYRVGIWAGRSMVKLMKKGNTYEITRWNQ